MKEIVTDYKMVADSNLLLIVHEMRDGKPHDTVKLVSPPFRPQQLPLFPRVKP